jgi:hypothetical protein
MENIGVWMLYVILFLLVVTIWRAIKYYIKKGYNAAKDKTLSSLEPAVVFETLKEKNFSDSNLLNRGLRILVCLKNKNIAIEQNSIIDKINDGIRSLCLDKAFDYKMKYVTENRLPIKIYKTNYTKTYSNAVNEFEAMNKKDGIVINQEENNFIQRKDVDDIYIVMSYLFDNFSSASVNGYISDNIPDFNHYFTDRIINLENNKKNISKKISIHNYDPENQHFIWLNGELIGSLSKLVFKAQSLNTATNNSMNVIYLTRTKEDKERYAYSFFEVATWDNDAILTIFGTMIELNAKKSGLKSIKNTIYDI